MKLIKLDRSTGAHQGGVGGSAESDFLSILFSASPVIVLSIFVAGLAGMAYIAHTPSVYRAQAIISVEEENNRVLKIERVESDDLKSEESLKTIEQSFTGPELLLQLINHNHLERDPAFLTELKRPATEGMMVQALTKRITATIRRGTRLIDLAIQDRSPVMAQKLTDLLIREFIEANLEKHIKVSERANSFLQQQAGKLEARLAKSDAAVQAYREQNQRVPLDESQNLVLEKLAKLSQLATDAKGARLQLEPDYEQVKKFESGSPVDLLVIPKIARSPGLVELQKSLEDKQAELAKLKSLYGTKYGASLALAGQQQELKAGLDRAILTAAAQVINEYNSAAVMEEKLEGALHEQEQAALDLHRKRIQYNILLREVESDRALWESVLARLKETDVAKGIQQDAIRIVSHPALPEKPVWPAKVKILLLSGFAGLAVGCGFSLLLRRRDRAFRTIDSAEERLGMPALGLIPKGPKEKFSGRGIALVKQRDSALAESFRSLRASLSLLGDDHVCKTFLFTSASPREGTSFCAVHCAVAFAQAGFRTLLIDADLRLPSLGSIFFGDPVDLDLGLSDCLTQRADLDDAARSTKIDNLFVLCSGRCLDTPAELLAGNAFAYLFKDAVTKFDRVVIDSAPILVVSDTLLLARQVPATCLVVSAQSSTKTVLEAERKLVRAGSMLAGFILNRASPRKSAKAYSRYYRAGYGGKVSNSSAGARRPYFPEPAALVLREVPQPLEK